MALDLSSFATDLLDGERARAARELEAAITISPRDPDPRTILCDLLLEAGDHRGHFIRLALDLDATGRWDARCRDLEREVGGLEARGGLAWSRALRAVGGFNAPDPEDGRAPFAYHRGFVELVRGLGRELVPRLDAAAAAAPICRVRLEQATGADLEALAATRTGLSLVELQLERAARGWLEGASLAALPRVVAPLESLSIRGQTTASLAAALSGAGALRALALEDDGTGEGIGAEGLSRLISSGALHHLRRLTLRRQSIGAEGVKLLSGLSCLEELTLEDDALGPKGAAALAAAQALASVRALALRGCELGDKGVRAVVASSSFVGLVRLDLAGNKINGKKLAPILDAFALPALRHLGLADSNLKVEGAKTLASTTALARLESLDLRGNTFKHEGAGLLAKAEGFPALVELELAGNTIDAVGLRALAEGPFMARVRALSLAQNKCGTEGGKALSRWPGLSALTSLSLSYNWMGVLGARALLERAGSLQVLHAGENNYGLEPVRAVAAGACPRLRVLRCGEADEASLLALATCPASRTLEELALGGSAIDERSAAAIAALPVLGRPSFSFCRPSPAAAALLARRFGPYLRTWGNSREWAGHPGPP